MSKKFIKSLIPPILFNILNKIINNKYGWKGNYTTWQDAKNESSGYDTDKILNAVKNSLLKVKNGEAAYERDSIVFDEIEYAWSLLAGLMFCSAKNEGGGSKCVILAEAWEVLIIKIKSFWIS
jgi:hypothetical protein